MPSRHRRWTTWTAGLLFMTPLASGCRPSAIEEPEPSSAAAIRPEPEPAPTAAETRSTEPNAAAWADAGQLVKENWDAIFLHGAKVGHTHTRIERIEYEGQLLTRTTSVSQLTISRAGDAGTQTMTVRSLQNDDGSLRELATELQAGPTATLTAGRVERGRLRLETTTTGQSFTAMLPWQDDWAGYFAIEQSLERDPLQPGETRNLKELQPGYNLLADVTLRTVDFEETEIGDRTQRLLRIEAETDIAGTRIQSLLWTDPEGRLVKSAVPSLQQTVLRTTREVALAESTGPSFDLLAATIVPLDRRIPRPHQTRRVVYRAELASQDPSKVFASSATQQVKRISDRVAEVTVTAITDDASPPGGQQPPEDDDLAPNQLIQSDDQRVVKLANSVLPGESDTRAVALELERLAHASIQSKNFTQAFATAADVAETLEGDCTEHAVLLAAMCRARGIPARVAIGLVYFERAEQPGFAYHMWTEAWVADRWLPLDGTLGRGGIGGGHLKLATSNLRGADGYTAFLPVFSVMGQLKLSLVSTE